MEGPSIKSASTQNLSALKQVVFNIGEKNIDSSVKLTMSLFDANFSFTSNVIIYNLVYNTFASRMGEANIYLAYLKSLQNKEEESNINNPKIIDIFGQYLSKNET